MRASIVQFQSTRKMGGETFSKGFEQRLEQQIKEAYESFIKRNESKHILHAYRTPAVLCTVMVLSYLISSLLDMLGVESLSRTAIFGLYIPLLLVGVWVYVRYSGDFREVGQMIDNVTEVMWEQVNSVTQHESHRQQSCLCLPTHTRIYLPKKQKNNKCLSIQ